MREDAESALAALIDEELAAVIFIRDYVELDFDGPRMSLFVWPTVSYGASRLRAGDPGYRDAVCSLIGHRVRSVGESIAAGLVIDFGIGSVITKPEPQDLTGPEIAHLRVLPELTRWMVWRPGEHPFTHL